MASTGNTSLPPCHQLALLLFRLLYYFVLWTLCVLSMSAPLRPWKALYGCWAVKELNAISVVCLTTCLRKDAIASGIQSAEPRSVPMCSLWRLAHWRYLRCNASNPAWADLLDYAWVGSEPMSSWVDAPWLSAAMQGIVILVQWAAAVEEAGKACHGPGLELGQSGLGLYWAVLQSPQGLTEGNAAIWFGNSM